MISNIAAISPTVTHIAAAADDDDDVTAIDRQPVYAEQVEPVDSEAESLLQYIATFNELMTSGKYKQAATHAANSPNAVLRTSATFQRFKGSLLIIIIFVA